MEYESIDQLLGTADGMETTVRNGGKNDDGTDTVAGVDWFLFDGVAAGTVYVSGNNWMGLGKSAEQLKVCRRDGATYFIYRQEGTITGRRFCKLRVEGYTWYSQTSDAYRLVYELFLLDTGHMFLNVVQAPTNASYLGESAVVCGGTATALTITAPTQISFYRQDDAGAAWEIRYEKLAIEPAYNKRYLVRSGRDLYTVRDGALAALETAEVTAAAFLSHGVEKPPKGALLAPLASPELLVWIDNAEFAPPVHEAAVSATPWPQTVQTDPQIWQHSSIKGVKSVTVDASDDVRFAFSWDEGVTWLAFDGAAWAAVAAAGGMTGAQLQAVTTEQWALAPAGRRYCVRWILPGADSRMGSVVVNYIN